MTPSPGNPENLGSARKALPANASVDGSTDAFVHRHIGPRTTDLDHMLGVVGQPTLDALMAAALPGALTKDDGSGAEQIGALTESEALAELRRLAGLNVPMTQMIGLGYSDTVTPAVIRRNIVESPAWYTSYTPYQPEISQGRLEALLVFQTMVEDLTGLPVANASLLDEASAVAEAVLLMRRAVRGRPDAIVLLDERCLPQSIAVTRAHAEAVGLGIRVADLTVDWTSAVGGADVLGVVVQQIGCDGDLADLDSVIAQARDRDALVTTAADLLSLTLLTPPGETGADIVVGSAQRFGVPLFYGGPHAAYMAVRSGLERQLPGRMVGVSVDADGNPAYRLALQTREQHIRREKATSNICTAQALLAVIAAMYAVWHGPEGLREIANRVRELARRLAEGLASTGAAVVHPLFFDTVLVEVTGNAEQLVADLATRGINVRLCGPDRVAVACDEVTTAEIVDTIVEAVARLANGVRVVDGTAPEQPWLDWPEAMRRTSDYLTHPTFHAHRSETAMMRYLRRLSDKDLALDRSMIPLGSCTMKLNSAIEMEPITWPGFAGIHPLVPADQTTGYRELIDSLERRLADLTGYAAVSVQPNAGSQGEYAGLLAIRGYHRSRGEGDRDICLIPASAHGTNAASAVLAGLHVVVVDTGDDGSISLDSLRAAVEAHPGRIAAIMITYPSTHGVYEPSVTTVCDLVHAAGGQVYIDGANLNALVGHARPGRFGGDVSHLNLHKTFAIPHGGGGPGVGPVCVREHLVPFLPADPMAPAGTGMAVSGAAYGSAGILPITWAYIALMGTSGLRAATATAVLAANYVATRLQDAFPVLYRGSNGLVAHECILDLRPVTKETGVTAEDVAKRLIDHGFHAPTMSFPVAGTLMVEPTESEDLGELDRFCDAMLAIRAEIDDVARGTWPVDDSPLRHAPHTAALVTAPDWDRPYSRAEGALVSPMRTKYWPPVARIDNAYGDRNLVCSCPPIDAYAQ